jgi:hypothetical protein
MIFSSVAAGNSSLRLILSTSKSVTRLGGQESGPPRHDRRHVAVEHLGRLLPFSL